MKISYRATSSARKGDRPILGYTTIGAAQTSPPKGVVRRMRHHLASAAGASTTSMSLLWAGRSSWRTWAEATLCYGTDDYATAGSGPTRQSKARDSELQQANRRGMCRVIAFTNSCSFLPEACSVTVWGRQVLNGTNVLSQLANSLLRIAVEEVQTKHFK